MAVRETIDLGAWSEFREQIAIIRKKYAARTTSSGRITKNEILFRGQSDSNWKLETTLERRCSVPLTFHQYLLHATSCAPEIESCTGKSWNIPDWSILLQRLRSSEESFDIQVPCYDYLVYLRQNGFPSPLLDWTSSPYVASYFAYCDNPGCDRVAVFAFIETPNGIKAGAGAGPWITVMGPKVRTHSRHFSQKAWYTIAAKRHDRGHIFCQHEDVVAAGNGNQDVLIKITMPMADRKAALQELEEHNINAFTLFQTEEALVRTMGLRQFDLKEVSDDPNYRTSQYSAKEQTAKQFSTPKILEGSLRLPQDRESGAAANKFGRETARKIAKAIGAKMVETNSNRCTLDGRNLVIKCARLKTSYIGLSYKMLDQIEGIIAAFENERGAYDLYQLKAAGMMSRLRPTASTGPAAGRVGLLRKSFCLNSGVFMQSVFLPK